MWCMRKAENSRGETRTKPMLLIDRQELAARRCMPFCSLDWVGTGELHPKGTNLHIEKRMQPLNFAAPPPKAARMSLNPKGTNAVRFFLWAEKTGIVIGGCAQLAAFLPRSPPLRPSSGVRLRLC
jgi:hypothetical protein